MGLKLRGEMNSRPTQRALMGLFAFLAFVLFYGLTVFSTVQPKAEPIAESNEEEKNSGKMVPLEEPVIEISGTIVKLTDASLEIEDLEGNVHKVSVPEALRKDIASAKVGDLAVVNFKGQFIDTITAPLPDGESWIIELTEDYVTLAPEPYFEGMGIRVRITKDTVIENGLKLEKGIEVHVEFDGDVLKYVSKLPYRP